MSLVINSVRSNIDTFKSVEFTSGLNIVLADTTEYSEQKDSRNGLGKSTLIEVIHFCLGSQFRKGKGIAHQALEGWSFTLEITINEEKYTVTRSTEKGSYNTIVIDGNTNDWPIQPKIKDGQTIISITDWNKILGELVFGLIINKDNEEKKFQPSFRGLISYFIRRTRDAFSTPFESYRKQLECDKQISNAFLLGLGWEYARKLQVIKDKHKLLDSIKKLKRTSDRQTVFAILGSLGELKTIKVRIDAQLRERQKELNNFRVHPQYRDLEKRANHLTVEIHQLTNQNFVDQRLVDSYELSLKVETEPKIDVLVSLYRSTGVELQSLVVRTLEEVENFHKKLIINRRDFLSAEITKLKVNLSNRSKEIQGKIEERANLLSVLNTHRALEEYTKLNELYLKDRSDLNEIEKRIEELERIDDDKSALIIEKAKLLQDARRDHHERLHQTENAIRLFNANSQFLYNAPGDLVINVNEDGFRFNVEIERDGSQGIGSMKVFCYDLMLAQIWAEINQSPITLIHDSTIFDGVDERQIAKALQLASTLSKNFGFQYICTFNSDMIPYSEFDDDFDFNSFVRLKLTDDNDEGRLLGISF
jgi:uncharacterized protein YydD (DUF2326 family)